MGSDFSTLDAELDALEGNAGLDALALAQGYAPNVSALPDVDRELGELHQGVEPQRDESAFVFRPSPARPPASEEIALPEPVTRDFQDDASGEIPLPDPSPRSGSFALDDELGASLSEERDASDAPAGLEAAEDASYRAAPNSTFERARANFDLSEPAQPSSELDADGAFAELFAEATRQSSMPSRARDAERNEEDTEVFDTAALGLAEAAAAQELSAEELDSDEFEIVSEDDDDDDVTTSSSLPPHPSQPPPEKRPSFLDRLFGRKHE